VGVGVGVGLTGCDAPEGMSSGTGAGVMRGAGVVGVATARGGIVTPARSSAGPAGAGVGVGVGSGSEKPPGVLCAASGREAVASKAAARRGGKGEETRVIGSVCVRFRG
jgi:hypothetical protein